MNTKRNLIGLIIWELLTISNQSITGVTYRDHFDFEERYRHDECNPLYWHPLHMPDHCTKMFEKLIRTRLYDTYPYKRIQNEQDEKSIRKLKRLMGTRRRSRKDSSESYDVSDEDSKYKADSSSSDPTSSDRTSDDSSKEVVYQYVIEEKNQQPYQQMLSMLKEDVMISPAMPVIGVLPSLGLTTFYRQPVSKKTEKTIKKLAREYGTAAQETYMDTIANFFPYPPYQSGPNVTNNTNAGNKKTIEINKTGKKKKHINKDEENKIKMQMNQMMEPLIKERKLKPNKEGKERTEVGQNKNNQVQTKKIVNGNSVTYIQKKTFFG